MSKNKKILVPDLGDFENVEVTEVLVNAGQKIEKNENIITVESDKASIDIPSDISGTIVSINVNNGDILKKDDQILLIKETTKNRQEKENPKNSKNKSSVMHDSELLVLGAGPGGYTAAFRAADLGMNVTLVERSPTLGGVCLNVGCIPSKALLHAANVIEQTSAMKDHGIRFSDPKIEMNKLMTWKQGIISKLNSGLVDLSKKRNVKIITGNAQFQSNTSVVIDNKKVIKFEKCIIAVGSESATIPGLPDDDRILDSSKALELEKIPSKMLIVGGGIIGLEMACVYHALGSEITVVELTDSLMPGTDSDLVKIYTKFIRDRYKDIYLKTKVSKIQPAKKGLKVFFEGNDCPKTETYDNILVSVGRKSNGNQINIEKTGVVCDQRGIIKVDKQMRTNIDNIFAIGDLTGDPMLAHKATHQAKVAAEVASGKKSSFDARVIPSVAYTDPEIAWVGVTENQAKSDGIDYEKSRFPWAASGRSLAIGRDEGFTKLLFEKETDRVIGGGIIGPYAGDLISEVALAIEMGADAADIGMTVHPHPTLSETIAFSAEAQEGILTDLYMPKNN